MKIDTPSIAKYFYLFTVTTLLQMAKVHSGLTIPNRAVGWTYIQPSSTISNTVTLSAYLDLTCPDSKQVFPTLLGVAEKLENQNFQLVVKSFSLPYHRNSHKLTMAAHVVERLTKGRSVFRFIAEVYNQQSVLTTSATATKTDAQVMAIITDIVTRTTNITATAFNSEISKGYSDSQSRIDFKYGCTRGVYAAPTCMLNDVVVDASDDWTMAQWLDLIQPLLKNNNH